MLLVEGVSHNFAMAICGFTLDVRMLLICNYLLFIGVVYADVLVCVLFSLQRVQRRALLQQLRRWVLWFWVARGMPDTDSTQFAGSRSVRMVSLLGLHDSNGVQLHLAGAGLFCSVRTA